MNTPKKQHYVPQFYLRNFDAKVKKNPSIYCFNVLSCNSYISNIKKVAQQSYFYESKNKDVNMEKMLSDIERESSKHIHNLVKNKNYKSLNNLRIRADLAYYMSIQYIRTDEKREFFKSQAKAFEEIISKGTETYHEYQNGYKDFCLMIILKMSI